MRVCQSARNPPLPVSTIITLTINGAYGPIIARTSGGNGNGLARSLSLVDWSLEPADG